MREMTQEELDYVFHTGRCPQCGSREMFEGGVGGMSFNIHCHTCGGSINLMGPANINLGGQITKQANPGFEAPDLLPPRKFLIPGGFVGRLCAWFAWVHPRIEERSLEPYYLDERAWPE